MERKKKKRNSPMKKVILIEVALVVAVLVLGIGWKNDWFGLTGSKNNSSHGISGSNGEVVDAKESDLEKKEKEERLAREKEEKLKDTIEKADKLAVGYFYSEAVKEIKSYGDDYASEPDLVAAIEKYKSQKKALKPYEGDVNHVFFHSLIADTSKAFDGDNMENGYNYWMTTVSEFKHMLEEMYKNDFILVDIHDVAGPVKEGDKTVFKKKEMLLPEGKKPFVLSQDDVNYYEYMKTDGFARRLVIDENGKIACEIELDGKTVVGRDYDVLPILDVFLEEHPDFSYRGAKGILALTGYEGALGYRTNDENSETLEEDKKAVIELAEAIKADGWEFASHSYGHRHMGTITDEKFIEDSKKWMRTIAPLIGETDIYIYPYGEEIDYKGKKFDLLKEQGFNYFCGVYARPWMEVGSNYVRMSRRNLDGFTMHFYPDRVKDLYDLDAVYDKSRPVFK